MFSRRYIRRNLLVALFLPIFLLSLFIVYQNRYLIFSKKTSHYHHEYNSHENIPNHNEKYKFSSKPTTTATTITSTSTKFTQRIKNSSLISQTFSPLNILKNNLIQKSSSPLFRLPTLPVIETKDLHRFIHLDLKGAAPKINYYKQLFPYLKQLGANGLLIEYEDMFPYTDSLSIIKHDFAYTKTDIEQILKLAEINDLKVMPLLQVYGHLEYVLKLKEYMHLREDNRYPQVITPCLEESYKLLFEMIDQMLLLHPSIPYLHIGCDEVYYRLIHPQCSNLHFRDESDLFIR